MDIDVVSIAAAVLCSMGENNGHRKGPSDEIICRSRIRLRDPRHRNGGPPAHYDRDQQRSPSVDDNETVFSFNRISEIMLLR